MRKSLLQKLREERVNGHVAFLYFRSSAQEQFMSNSVIVGLSKNIGEPAVNSTRSYPLSYDQ